MNLRRCLVLAALTLGACSGDNAGVITVTGTAGGVLHLDIHIATHNKQHTATLSVPASEGMPLVFPTTVSITFPSGLGSSYLDACVEGKAGAMTMAKGSNFAQIVEGGVTEIMVPLMADTTPCGQ